MAQSITCTIPGAILLTGDTVEKVKKWFNLGSATASKDVQQRPKMLIGISGCSPVPAYLEPITAVVNSLTVDCEFLVTPMGFVGSRHGASYSFDQEYFLIHDDTLFIGFDLSEPSTITYQFAEG